MIPIAKPLIGEDEQAAVRDVLASGMIAHGPVTEAFEKEFAAAHNVAHAVAVTNGTVALTVALMAAGIGPGDKVAVPAFTFIATANSVLSVGAEPVFVDADEYFTMDPKDLARVIDDVQAVIPVHLYGQAADMDAIIAVADGKPVIEDAAQAHGAALNGRPVGSMGTAGCFSMYPTKNMTSAEGGMITTNDGELAETMRSIRNHGRGKSELGTYDHVRFGLNYRSTDVCSAIGRTQLSRLPALNQARKEHAAEVRGDNPAITLPRVRDGAEHVYHQFTVRVKDRAGFMEYLKTNGVGCGVYYPKVLYQYPHLTRFARACPASEGMAEESVSIPVHPGMSAADVAQVKQILAGWA